MSEPASSRRLRSTSPSPSRPRNQPFRHTHPPLARNRATSPHVRELRPARRVARPRNKRNTGGFWHILRVGALFVSIDSTRFRTQSFCRAAFQQVGIMSRQREASYAESLAFVLSTIFNREFPAKITNHLYSPDFHRRPPLRCSFSFRILV